MGSSINKPIYKPINNPNRIRVVVDEFKVERYNFAITKAEEEHMLCSESKEEFINKLAEWIKLESSEKLFKDQFKEIDEILLEKLYQIEKKAKARSCSQDDLNFVIGLDIGY